MGFDHLDLVYSERPPVGLPVAEVVGVVGDLIADGKARAWGVLNWAPETITEAARVAVSEGLPAPCAAQLAYNLADPHVVEDASMTAALREAGAGVVASFVLAGGALTGKYSSVDAAGRLGAERESPRYEEAFRIGERLREIAADTRTTPARLRSRMPLPIRSLPASSSGRRAPSRSPTTWVRSRSSRGWTTQSWNGCARRRWRFEPSSAYNRRYIGIARPELEHRHLSSKTAYARSRAPRSYRPGMSDVGSADPVSWLLIRPGWKVVSADGAEIGRVDEVAGDDEHDIFDGLAVATSALGRPRYVPSEQVGEITEGVVRLKVTREDAMSLGEYLEPATSARIEPDDKGGLGETLGADVREVEAKVLAPTQRHEHSMNVWRRIAFWLRRTLHRT
jgi:hypothetical protein